MSGNLAYALTHSAPSHRPDVGRRHIEIVTSREQRRARPRLAYSLVIIVGLFAVLATQLLLSIGLADGAYQISALQAKQKELSRSHQMVAEQLNILGSPQNLAVQAESLGMVSDTSAAFLNLADGAVLGAPAAAAAGSATVVGSDGALLIPNSVLGAVASNVAASSAEQAAGSASAVTGAPVTGPTGGSAASTTTGIPGPTTR